MPLLLQKFFNLDNFVVNFFVVIFKKAIHILLVVIYNFF